MLTAFAALSPLLAAVLPGRAQPSPAPGAPDLVARANAALGREITNLVALVRGEIESTNAIDLGRIVTNFARAGSVLRGQRLGLAAIASRMTTNSVLPGQVTNSFNVQFIAEITASRDETLRSVNDTIARLAHAGAVLEENRASLEELAKIVRAEFDVPAAVMHEKLANRLSEVVSGLRVLVEPNRPPSPPPVINPVAAHVIEMARAGKSVEQIGEYIAKTPVPNLDADTLVALKDAGVNSTNIVELLDQAGRTKLHAGVGVGPSNRLQPTRQNGPNLPNPAPAKPKKGSN